VLVYKSTFLRATAYMLQRWK